MLSISAFIRNLIPCCFIFCFFHQPIYLFSLLQLFTSISASPNSLPNKAWKGTSSTPTRVTLLGSFFAMATAASMQMKLVPISTTSLSFVTAALIACVSCTCRRVTTPFKSAPGMGIFFGFAPGERTRWSYFMVVSDEVTTICFWRSTLVTDCFI